jgi:hypothetical protein
MADFTPTQGRYLAYIHAYTVQHGYPPAESEIAAAMCVSPPSVCQMVKTLQKKRLIRRYPGQSRTIQILIPENEIPAWNARTRKPSPPRSGAGRRPVVAAPPPASAPSKNLYVLSVFLTDGPVSEEYAGKVVKRVIEIRGDQTLAQLHQAIFEAFGRWEQHLYEFQFGRRPFDPAGRAYGLIDPSETSAASGDARTTRLDDLNLKPERVFGYWFDFGDDWYHQIMVDRIEHPSPTATYPRVIKRQGKSPPQYAEE